MIKEGWLSTLFVKDLKDIVVALSHVAFDENHMTNWVLPED